MLLCLMEQREVRYVLQTELHFPCKFSDLRPLTSPRKFLNVMEGKALKKTT